MPARAEPTGYDCERYDANPSLSVLHRRWRCLTGRQAASQSDGFPLLCRGTRPATLYGTIVAQPRLASFYSDFAVADTGPIRTVFGGGTRSPGQDPKLQSLLQGPFPGFAGIWTTTCAKWASATPKMSKKCVASVVARSLDRLTRRWLRPCSRNIYDRSVPADAVVRLRPMYGKRYVS